MDAVDIGKLSLYLYVEIAIAFALLMLSKVDWIVNSALYEYDLKYSVVWATPYNTFVWSIICTLGLAMILTAVLGFLEYRRIKRLSRLILYICETCGNAWTSAWAKSEIRRGKESKIKMIKSCPLCNDKLLA